MNQKKMYALISHYDTYFKQDDCRLLHSVVMEPHIDALLYAPNELTPFGSWSTQAQATTR